MIALGRSGDGQLNTDLDGNHFNVPMADTAGQRIAGGIAGAVAPTVATMGLGEGLGAVAGAGRAAQAVRGVGQLLSGSKGLQIAGAATGGAANVAGQEAGLSPEDAALLGLGASFIPGAGMAARAAAGNAARGAFVGSIAKTLAPEEAAQTVRAGTALDGYGGAGSAAAQAAYGADLNATVGGYRRAAVAAGYIDPEDGRAIGQATTAANNGTAAPGTAAAGVRALGLPADHQAALEGSLGQLQAVSALPSGGAAVGPISSLVARAAPYVAGLSALGAAHGGDYIQAAELAGGAIGGATVAGPMLRMAGTVGDRLLGTAMSPAEARLAAAQQVVGRTGMDTSGNPLTALQTAMGDAQTQAGILQAANDQLAAQARGQNLADTAGNWFERQLIQGAKKRNPDVPITGAASLTARTPQELFEATAGRYGSPADPTQAGLMMDAQQQYGPAPAPAAPRTAPPSGSPAGVSGGPPPGQPVGMLQGQAGGASASLQQPPVGMSSGAASAAPLVGPFDPTAAPSGGVALASMMHQDLTGRAATTAQLHRSAGAVLDPQTAFEFASGTNTSRDTAYKVALHAAQSVPDQAASDVSAVMGTPGKPMPNGGPRGPVLNLPRYQAAVGSYQQHARMMFQVAPMPAAKTAVAQIAATPAAADKQAVLDVYKAENPGADASVFTPQLMKGVGPSPQAGS